MRRNGLLFAALLVSLAVYAAEPRRKEAPQAGMPHIAAPADKGIPDRHARPPSKQQTSGSPTVPAGMIAFFRTETCPSGWSEAEAARGRILVGVTDEEDQESIGEALRDRLPPEHEHEISADIERDWRRADSSPSFGLAAEYKPVIEVRETTRHSTNQLPFFQLLACRKD